MYRGIDVTDLADGFIKSGRNGFEETCYLLLFGNLPNKKQLADFEQILADYRYLPDSFVRDMILNAPSKDMMNVLARSVLTFYSYDDRADDTSIANVLEQCIRLIACFLIAVYGYHAYSHYHENKVCLFIARNQGKYCREYIAYVKT